MSLQDLSLPVDVPWKLIATSQDMLASHAQPFPNGMWRSSVAVFAYDPDLSDLPDVFTDRELTFVKVVCSVTGYTPCHLTRPRKPDASKYRKAAADIRQRVKELLPKLFAGGVSGLKDGDAAIEELAKKDPALARDLATVKAYQADVATYDAQIEEIARIEGLSFPCYGALLQVAIYPKTDPDPAVTDPGEIAASLAYFSAFEPQKRELIEVVTESGEAVTQSKSDVNVRKGVTSTNTTEDMDVFSGANVNVGYAGAQVGVGIQGQWGTIKKSTQESVDITNTDASREARETASHTTNLSQLYHLLSSYHLGTNRALFFLQPRPHTVQQKDRFTFIDGPQEIEGVQEFFLVVNRPKGKTIGTDYCVDALLYTAHLEPDATRAVLMEPKTYETPWFELWGGAQTPKKNQDDFYKGLAEIAGEFFFGVPFGDPTTSIPVLANTFVPTQYSDVVNALFNQPPNAPTGAVAVAPVLPVVVDQTFTYKPGWRVDRTRGLGGYDLWEDPDNVTWNPLGESSAAKVKPQAFIDVFSTGNPDDPLNYRADTHLRVQSFVFPKKSQGDSAQTAFYHARIKVYFIRDDMPDPDRTLPMFVTVRGVGNCADSPFSNLYLDSATAGSVANVVAQRTVIPPNVAPWTTPQQAVAGVPVPTDDPVLAPSIETRRSQASAVPSGVDPASIGAARTKMANGISDEVRSQFHSAFACIDARGGDALSFSDTDLVYRRLATAALAVEVRRLFATAKTSELAYHVAAHPAARSFGVVPLSVGSDVIRSLLDAPVAADPSYPLLTFANAALGTAAREALLSAGVGGGLDLVGLSADDLAARLGKPVAEARALRRAALGIASSPPSTPEKNHDLRR